MPKKNHNVVAVVQARLGSTRFPKKVLQPIQGVPLLGVLLERLQHSQEIHKIVVATTDKQHDDPLASYVKTLGVDVVRGSEDDVLARYAKAMHQHPADCYVRITGDCPLIDPALVDRVIERYKQGGFDYVNNIDPPTYPDGLDIEVFSASALQLSLEQAKSNYEREHVTPYLRTSSAIKRSFVVHEADLSHYRWTVDEPEDFQVITKVFEAFYPRKDFSWYEVLELMDKKPEIFEMNNRIKRNEGAHMTQGQKLWKRAKKIIPGGTMLLSKRPNMYLPEGWPSYFSRAKGCQVWDLDNTNYVDMCLMGIGTNTLGYGHEEVDEAVQKVISLGNMSTLNCPEEVYLAEKLVELHPWSEMVRLARTGGEANAIAIRIARAATGKEKIAICGYHGWHDWYLATNLARGDSLKEHLLPGLSPCGVPTGLQDTVLPFQYNSITEFDNLISLHGNELAAIKMEVSRNFGPAEGYLQHIRDVATKYGIVLIFDECTSGFRETFGGLHKKYNVSPDMAVFGKTLGNGYAITAVLGKGSVMEAAQSTFISSTFWTERIGPSAALKTLEVMEREKSWEVITERGHKIRHQWNELAQKHNLHIDVSGIPALSTFTFKSPKHLEYKTYITQAMLKKGYLANTAVYTSIAHDNQTIEDYFSALDEVFAQISDCESGKESITNLLEYPVCQTGFQRLN